MILARSLAETFLFYMKAHIFHWNVVGPDFPEYHKLFNDIYDDAHGAVDDIAEHVRASGELAPMSLDKLIAPGNIAFSDNGNMIVDLALDNAKVIVALREDFDATDDQGLKNFLADRIDRHEKWGWMLRATQGKTGK